MRKIIMFNLTSIDGYFEGENHDISWHNLDDEFEQFAIEQTGKAGILLFGRVTYQLMADFWPTEQALKTDPIIAKMMNETPKIVFSSTLSEATWSNTALKKEINAEEIKDLKKKEGKDIFIFGSSDLTVSMMELGLIDEYRILVNPIILGNGKPLFQGIEKPLKLKLLSSRVFKNGNVLLSYENAI